MYYCSNCGKSLNDSVVNKSVDLTRILPSYKETGGQLSEISKKRKALKYLNSNLTEVFNNFQLPIDYKKNKRDYMYCTNRIFDVLQEALGYGEIDEELYFEAKSDVDFKQNRLIKEALLKTDPQEAAELILKAVDRGAMGEYMWE